jgi:hypothetical protein
MRRSILSTVLGSAIVATIALTLFVSAQQCATGVAAQSEADNVYTSENSPTLPFNVAKGLLNGPDVNDPEHYVMLNISTLVYSGKCETNGLAVDEPTELTVSADLFGMEEYVLNYSLWNGREFISGNVDKDTIGRTTYNNVCNVTFILTPA